MSRDTEILCEAREAVERERSELRDEIQAWNEFREAVRLATPTPDEGTATSGATARLVQTYQNTVMATPDFRRSYEDTLEESLEIEFTASLADALVSSEEFTQLMKRKLLVASSDAIKRRERLNDTLDEERQSLEYIANVLECVSKKTEKLPDCSIQTASLEKLLRIWEDYEDLKQACERLLSRRQREIRTFGRTFEWESEPHSINVYLYSELKTPYPVLSAIASVSEQIERVRPGTSRSERETPRR